MVVDLLIIHGIIVTIDAAMNCIFDGAIAIQNQRILAIGKTEEISKKYGSKKTIDATGCIVMPGFINTHTHIPMTYFRGLADDLPLHTWLQDHIWPAEAKCINEEFIYHASLHGAAECVLNGITTFNDMYFHGNSIAKAAKEIGIRACIGEAIMDMPVAGYTSADQIIAYAVKHHSMYNDSDQITFTIAPHAIYSCTKETLITARDAAQKNNMRLHIHVSETKDEVKRCIEKYGKRPIQYLYDLGLLGSNVTIAHGVWVTENEIELLEKTQTNVAIATESNLKLASGFAPIKSYLMHNINISLATDGVASNNNLDMLSEMDITAKLHKAYNNDPTLLPAQEVVRMATINGARAIGMEDRIGSLECGKYADIICINYASCTALPMYDVYSHLVYALSNNNIQDVIIGGKVILNSGTLCSISSDELIERAYYYQEKISKL